MIRFWNIVRKRRFFIFSAIIVVLATFLRFYNYHNRWGIGGDQAHFALLSRHALATHQLPLLGPFSSAGPFQTGGEWYWFVMLGTIWNTKQVVTPWIFLTVTYIFFVIGMIFLGNKVLGKWFGLLLGLLSAISTAELLQATILSNQSPINLCTLAAILCMFFYVKTKKNRYLFLEAFAIGIASSIHLQGVALVVLLVATIIFQFPNWQGILLIPFGVLIPWLPVFYIDAGRNFTNTHNMIYYYLFEKNKPSLDVLGRRWLTFSTQFIPYAWSSVIGGYPFIGYIEIIVAFIALCLTLLKAKIKREWLVIFVSIPFLFTILRYTATPLFDSYFVFLHPFILLVTGWTLFNLIKKFRIVGIIFLIVVCFTTIYVDVLRIHSLQDSGSHTNPDIQRAVLEKLYPHKKFAIYDYQFKTSAYSQAVALFLDVNGKIDDKEMKIGYVSNSFYNNVQQYPIIGDKNQQFLFLSLGNISQEQLRKEDWVLVDPSGIYDQQENWYKYKK